MSDFVSRQRLWQMRNPVKNACHRIFKEAVESGRLVRPAECEQCGVVCVPHGHHEDHFKPLEVVWLCDECHGMRRKQTDPGPRVVVAARIRRDAREKLVASLRDGERLSDRIRAILERAALRAA